MKTLAEMEKFLETQTAHDFRASMERGDKVKWLLENGDYARESMFKMRGIGKLAWKNFLWSFGLKETIVLEQV